MQRLRKQFLANAGGPGKQHGCLRRRDALDQMARSAEGGRNANQLFAVNRWGSLKRGVDAADFRKRRHHAAARALRRGFQCEIAQVFFGIRPLVDRAAGDLAGFGTHRLAGDFAKNNHLAHEGAGVAAGVTHLHPAGRFGANAEGGNMLFVFGRVVPGVFGQKVAALNVKLQPNRLGSYKAGHLVHARPGVVSVGGVAVGPQAPHHFGIPRAGRVTHAGQQRAGLILTHAGDEFAAHRPISGRTQQHHALVVEPDSPVAG